MRTNQPLTGSEHTLPKGEVIATRADASPYSLPNQFASMPNRHGREFGRKVFSHLLRSYLLRRKGSQSCLTIGRHIRDGHESIFFMVLFGAFIACRWDF